jgi:biopolymer transport protein ExbD
MAHPYDVWFVAANQVYKGVPYAVVTDWAEQGRLGAEDQLRPTGLESAWIRAADHPEIRDFLFTPAATRSRPSDLAEQLQPIEGELHWRHHGDDEDDDVDMIPLIDISLVLLIFFMMTTAVAALSPINVPEMKHASSLARESDAMTVLIDKRTTGEVIYALQRGNAAPAPEDNNLPTLRELLARLDARLAEAERPPEVRIACNQELPRERVRELARELNQRKNAGKIAFFGAEVHEVSP